jgi:Outer membrane protein beta-barrel domain
VANDDEPRRHRAIAGFGCAQRVAPRLLASFSTMQGNASRKKEYTIMTVRMIFAAGTLGALISSPAFADDELSTSAAASKMSAQVQVELLPLGSAATDVGDIGVSVDTSMAFGVSAGFEYAVAPYLSIGVAPRLILNVTSEQAKDAGQDAGKELDLRARIRGHVPVSPGLELYASLSPGYTILLSPDDEDPNAKGFGIAGAVGVTYDLSPRMFIGGEVGYQRAFASATEQSVTMDVDVSYMHIGLGAGTRF